MKKLSLLLLAGIVLTSLSVAQADQTLVDLIKKVKPCVVLIETFDKDNKPIGQGSGFFIDNKGRLITNHHVVEGAYSATIKTSAGKEYPVQGIVAKDTEADIVKLVVNLPDANMTFLNLSVNVPSEGEDIIVIGNPLGLESTYLLMGGSGGAGFNAGVNWTFGLNGVQLRTVSFGYGAGVEAHGQLSQTFVFGDWTLGPQQLIEPGRLLNNI